MLESVLYVSTSKLDPAIAEGEVAALVAASDARNQNCGLTGALIFTGTHFVQIFEGTPDTVERMLRSLRADERHADLVIIERAPISARRFSRWSIAYAGPSRFIGRQVSRVLNDPSPGELRRAAGWLTDLMQEFVAR